MRLWQTGLAILLFSSLGRSETTSQTFSQLQAQLLTSNPELQSARASMESQISLSKAQSSAWLPEISVHGGYGKEDTLADVHEGYVGYLAGNWNLFKGGIDLQLKKISEHEAKIASHEYEATKRKLVSQLGESYYEALLNTHFIALDTEKIQFLKNQRAMAQKKINAGLTSSIDALELDLEESTLNAEIDTHKTDLQNSLNAVQALVAHSEKIQVTAQETFPQHSLADFPERELSNNPNLQKQQLLEESAHFVKRQVLASYLPSVDVTAEYGQIIPHFADPLRGAESKLFVLLSWTFFSGMDSYNKSSAATQNIQAQTWKRTNQQLQIHNDLKNLRNKASELVRLQTLLEKRQTFTQKYYDLTLSEYRRGVKNSSDLANATNSLFENKTKLFQVQKDLAVLKLKYDELTL